MVRNIEVQNTFSGPLDLLLYLVKRDEIDIHDIPVGHVTREYLLEIDKMQEIDVDAGGDFLAMASMLTEIKGRMLLPDVVSEDAEEEEIYDPRQGLVEALLEYKKFKEVAAELQGMSSELENRYSRIVPEPEFQAVIKEKAQEMGALDLLAAFQRIARKMLNERAPREIVSEEVPTEIRIQQIEEVVALRGRVSFSSILSDSPSDDEMVGFFIAMLELIRMKKIRAQQAVDFSEIYFISVDGGTDFDENAVVETAEVVESDLVAGGKISVLGYAKRNSAFSMSNAFGVIKLKSVSVKNNLELKWSGFDFLMGRKNKYNRIVKYQYKNSVFPPLVRSGSGMVKAVACLAEDIQDERRNEAVTVLVSEQNIQLKIMLPFRVNQHLADMFAWWSSKRKSLSEEITVTGCNRFDMLRFMSGTKKRKSFFSGRKFLQFMQLDCGRIAKYKVSDNIAAAYPDVLVKNLAINDNKSGKLTIQTEYRISSLADIFCLHFKMGKNNNNSGSEVMGIVDILSLRKNHIKPEMKSQWKYKNFLRLYCGRVQQYTKETAAIVEPVICTPSENGKDTNLPDVFTRMGEFHLASVLNLQCGKVATKIAGNNNFDFLKVKTVNTVNADRRSTQMRLYKFLGL